MGSPSMGHASQLGLGAASPVDEAYEFVACDVGKTATHVQTEGIRGTRSRIAETVVEGTYSVGGSILMRPTPEQIDKLLPRILGGAESLDTFPLAETLPEFFLTIDKVAKVYTYAGCKVARASFRSAAGADLELSLEVEGKTEAEAAAGTFPSGLALSAVQPYVHHQAILTLGGTSYEMDNVEIVIDNQLITDRYFNSQTRTALPEGDRTITVSCDLPFSSTETSLYDMAIAGVAGSVVFTNGGKSLTFTFANLKAPAQPLGVRGRNQEIPLRLEMTAYKSGTTDELVVVNDVTA